MSSRWRRHPDFGWIWLFEDTEIELCQILEEDWVLVCSEDVQLTAHTLAEAKAEAEGYIRLMVAEAV